MAFVCLNSNIIGANRQGIDVHSYAKRGLSVCVPSCHSKAPYGCALYANSTECHSVFHAAFLQGVGYSKCGTLIDVGWRGWRWGRLSPGLAPECETVYLARFGGCVLAGSRPVTKASHRLAVGRVV